MEKAHDNVSLEVWAQESGAAWTRPIKMLHMKYRPKAMLVLETQAAWQIQPTVKPAFQL